MNEIVGKRINMICFSEFVNYIHFDEKTHIRVESSSYLYNDKSEKTGLFPFPSGNSIEALMGNRINGFSISEDIIKFDIENGLELIIELNYGYESVSINVDGNVEVIGIL